MKRNKAILILLLLALTNYLFAQDPIKIAHGPYLQNITPTEMTVVWLSDKPSIGWVEVAPDDNSDFYAVERPKFFDTRDGVKQTSKIHSVKIEGLAPSTRYRYRVCVTEVTSHVGNKVIYGNNAGLDVYSRKPHTFITSNPQSQTISFAMINDIHGNNDRLQNLIGRCDLKNTDFILFNGDMMSQFNEEAHIFGGFMDKAVELFASDIPVYYARGNHETRGAFAPSFHSYFSTKEEKLYYTFRQGPICFIVLDTGEDKPDSDIEYYGITDYDNYRSEQAAWLKKVIASEEYKSAPFKIVVAHIPPMGGWHGNLEVENKFVPILNEGAPDMLLCGHLHKYINQKPNAKASFPIIVNSNNSVLKVEANNKQLNVNIVDDKGNAIDRFTLTK